MNRFTDFSNYELPQFGKTQYKTVWQTVPTVCSGDRFSHFSVDIPTVLESIMGGGESKKTFWEEVYDTDGEDAFIAAAWKSFIKQEDYDALKDHPFDFDCLVFEGGGVKGAAYAGGLKVRQF